MTHDIFMLTAYLLRVIVQQKQRDEHKVTYTTWTVKKLKNNIGIR